MITKIQQLSRDVATTRELMVRESMAEVSAVSAPWSVMPYDLGKILQCAKVAPIYPGLLKAYDEISAV